MPERPLLLSEILGRQVGREEAEAQRWRIRRSVFIVAVAATLLALNIRGEWRAAPVLLDWVRQVPQGVLSAPLPTLPLIKSLGSAAALCWFLLALVPPLTVGAQRIRFFDAARLVLAVLALACPVIVSITQIGLASTLRAAAVFGVLGLAVIGVGIGLARLARHRPWRIAAPTLTVFLVAAAFIGANWWWTSFAGREGTARYLERARAAVTTLAPGARVLSIAARDNNFSACGWLAGPDRQARPFQVVSVDDNPYLMVPDPQSVREYPLRQSAFVSLVLEECGTALPNIAGR